MTTIWAHLQKNFAYSKVFVTSLEHEGGEQIVFPILGAYILLGFFIMLVSAFHWY